MAPKRVSVVEAVVPERDNCDYSESTKPSVTILIKRNQMKRNQMNLELEQGNPGETTNQKLRVLVACEYSGVVRDAFIARGHHAMSCDILPTDKPGKHYQGDVRDVLDDGWDLMICHPPCTYLSVSGIHWNNRGRGWEETEKALDFVRLLMGANISRIALENPVSIISSRIRKPDQIIHPHQFGHDASKATCLWLKNLLKLQPTENVLPRIVNGKPRWANQTDGGQNKLAPSDDRWKLRSTTYQGIADAMALAWG